MSSLDESAIEIGGLRRQLALRLRDLESEIIFLHEKAPANLPVEPVSPDFPDSHLHSVPEVVTTANPPELSACSHSSGTQTEWTIPPSQDYHVPPLNGVRFGETVKNRLKSDKIKARTSDPVLKEFQKQKISECISNIRSGLTVLRDPLRQTSPSSSYRLNAHKKLPDPQRYVSLVENPRPRSHS
jgi:hypothetical protein